MRKNSDRLFRLSSNLHQGFTLVELLVVIMIIGILTGIALPAFLQLTNKAKGAEGKQIVRDLLQRQMSYYHETGGYFAKSFQELGFTSKTETENYLYQVFSNSSLNGSLHLALSKKLGLKSYVSVAYLKNEVLQSCPMVEVDLIAPLASPSNFLVLNDVLSNPAKYCRQ